MKGSMIFYLLFVTCVSIGFTSAAQPSGAPDDVCDLTLNRANLMRNNEDHPTKVCVDNHLDSVDTTVKVCLVTTILSPVRECTTVTVDGAVLIQLPCQRHGKEFAATTESPTSPVSLVNITGSSNTSVGVRIEPQVCAKYGDEANGDEFCADMKTDDISQCTSVTFKGASLIAASCSCIKYNEFKIQVIRSVDENECKAKTAEDDDIQIHYTATNPAKQEFDNSYYNGIPVNVELGAVQFMRGWDHGLVGMCEGELRKLTIPQVFFGGRSSDSSKILTYPGGAPHPLVEDSDTLTFTIELVKIGSEAEAKSPSDEL